MPKEPPQNLDEKLDTIITYLHRLDKRDRLRTWGGLVRNLIALIPIILVLWSAWYFATHGDEILRKITRYAAQSAAGVSRENSEQFMQQFKLMFPGGE